jgi:hypothetical protein
VHEGSAHQAVGVHVADAGLARAGEGGVVLQVFEASRHRRVVGLPGGHAHLGPTQGPQAGQGLRRREGQVPARDPIGPGPDLVARSQGLTGGGMHRFEQPGQLVGGHLAGQVLGSRALSHPGPGRFAPPRVVVLQAPGHLVAVVGHGGGGDLAPAQHDVTPGSGAGGTAAEVDGTAGCQCVGGVFRGDQRRRWQRRLRARRERGRGPLRRR